MNDDPCNYVVKGDIATCAKCGNVWPRNGPEPYCERSTTQYIRNTRKKMLRIMYISLWYGFIFWSINEIVKLLR